MSYCKDNNFSTLSNEVFTGNRFANILFSVKNEDDFNSLALRVFRYQYDFNPVYGEYVKNLGINPLKVERVCEIPFLPIGFFKTHQVQVIGKQAERIFQSSGTTGQQTSKHYVSDLNLYHLVSTEIFNRIYGNLDDFILIGLLPSYLERKDSSLVEMVHHFIHLNKHPDSGFYLNEFESLKDVIHRNRKSSKKLLLIGVTFALLDFAELFPFEMENCIIMETGGMKGRKKEMVREEVHALLKSAFNLQHIHAEYGMTELLSQCYSSSNGRFHSPDWVRVLIREADDPLTIIGNSKTGGVNVIDLANINSCCFIATQDLGRTYNDGSFEILGRFDNSDIRGCSLMAL